MTVAEWMLLASVLVYLLTIAPFKPLGYREFDNAKPRDPKFYETPLRNRALGAHMNGIESSRSSPRPFSSPNSATRPST